MLNRRLFLKTSSATLASLASINPALAKGRTSSQNSVLDLVLFDDRVEASMQFASDARESGSATAMIRDDLNDENFAVLTEQFSTQKAIIAGYTKSHTAAYVLALARDHAYQQVHFAEFEPALSQLLNENNQGAGDEDKLMAWVIAPLTTRS